MAIASSDLLFQLTTLSGTAGNQTASTPAASLGKYESITAFAAGTNSLFDDVSGAENAASDVEYRAFAVLNNHASLTALAAVVYLSAEVAGGAAIAIGVDPTAASPKGSSTAQGVSVADEQTAPAGVTFSSPTTAAGGIALGDIPAGSVRIVWVRRTAANTSALDADGVTFGVSCDTAA